MVRLPLPVQRLDDDSYVSMIWGCRTHDELVDQIAGLFSEQPGLLDEIDADDFALWRVECAGVLSPGELERLERLQLWEVIQRAYVHRNDRVAWSARWLTGKWGKRDLLDGIAATDPDLRERIVREGLDAREARDRLEARIDDDHERALEDPPQGRDGWPGLWSADRGRDRHRERT